MFFLIDLDGTLLNTDYLHYQAWSKVLKLSPEYVEKIVTTHGINYILEDFPDPSYLRRQKIKEMLQFEEIKPMKNAETFIRFIVENNIDHAVVTNTDRKVVEHFKQKVPILNKLKKWIVREDYEKPKPDPECYRLALGDHDGTVFGFENSKEGLEALSKVTGNIFHIHPKTDYLKVLEQLKIQCPKRFGMHPTNLNHMGKKRSRLSKPAFAMVGSLALVIALQNLKSGCLTSSERNMDSL
jgi:beta-phosphoglucomutase-like phosphatase (HAD superfamily)